MRLGLLDSRALFPFFHPTLPTTAGIPENGCWRLLAACRCCSRRRSGLVPLYGAAMALLALSPLTTGAINAWKEGWAGGCWYCVDDVTRCCQHQSLVRRRRLLAHCRQCVKVRPDEMSGMNEMKPAGADGMRMKKKIRQQQQGQGSAVVAACDKVQRRGSYEHPCGELHAQDKSRPGQQGRPQPVRAMR